MPAVLSSNSPDMKKLNKAASSLATLAANESLEQKATAIAKAAAALEAGVKKADTKTAAAAAITLTDTLVDYTYAYEEKEKPLQELGKGAPAVYDLNRPKVDLPVSGKRI